MKRFFTLIWRITTRATEHDDYALASHMALSSLTAMFPFLIFVASLAGVLGTGQLQSEVVGLLFETWPHAVSQPIADEVNNAPAIRAPAWSPSRPSSPSPWPAMAWRRSVSESIEPTVW